jgi:hypothetical protein
MDRLLRTSEILKNFGTLVAALAAAIWALFLYNIKDAPQYSPQLSLSSDIEFNEITEEHCRLTLSVDISNETNSTVTVRNVSASLWYFNFPSQADGDMQLIDFKKIETAEEPAWILPDNGDYALLNPSPPKARYSYDFALIDQPRQESHIYTLVNIDTNPETVGKFLFFIAVGS